MFPTLVSLRARAGAGCRRRGAARGSRAAVARLVGSALAASALACVGVAPPAPAYLEIEVWRGFASGTRAADAPRVALVLDVTPSMKALSAAGPRRLDAARAAAARFAAALPDDAILTLHTPGSAPESCRLPEPIVFSLAKERSAVLQRLAEVGPSSEASLAQALSGVSLASGPGSEPQRVVAFTDLENACGGDLCHALEDLAARGTAVDLVLFGAARPPACAAQTHFATEWRSVAGTLLPPPRFRVEAASGDPRRSRSGVGRADGRPVRVPSGRVNVSVDLAPPERIESIDLAPGSRTRLLILDFPELSPPVRELHWEQASTRGGPP